MEFEGKKWYWLSSKTDFTCFLISMAPWSYFGGPIQVLSKDSCLVVSRETLQPMLQQDVFRTLNRIRPSKTKGTTTLNMLSPACAQS
jgi:hypothetical protein